MVAGTLTGWPSKLDDHKPFLHQRWNSGCTNIGQLHREITERGYRGSYGTVYAYLRPFKALPCAPPAVPAPPKVRTGRRGEQLDAWIAKASAGDQPQLHSFANGIRRDYQAVLTGLALPYSSAAMEGNVNKIKMIKRQMYGRAGFPLLRKRVILHPA